MIHPFQDIVAPLDRSAASIESAFLEAGDSLSRGLAMFDQLGSSLSALMGELDSVGLNEAATALDDLSRGLVRISGTLPEDAATLQALVAGNEAIAKHLDALLERMRTMAIIARSFRIEASQFSDAPALDSFTQEIRGLIKGAQDEISSCATQHTATITYLRGVAKAQVALDHDYREPLLDLARDLSETFALLQQRQTGGSALMRTVAERSGRITQTAAMAMVSLQAGDSTRQRLEHISEGVGFAAALSRGEAPGPAVDVPPPARLPAAAVLCRLQAAQIQDAVSDFAGDVRQIDEALQCLARDTHELASGGQDTYGSGGQGSNTFLTAFRTRLSRATQLLQTCEASRQDVERATGALRTMLQSLNETTLKLKITGRDLFLVGVNAGLKAGRLGSESRSLLVIADELKRLAQDIAKVATQLIEVFSEVQPAASRLDRAEAPGEAARSAQADQQIVGIVAALDAGDRKVTGFLADLTGKLGRFDADLTRARRDFTSAVAMNDDLLEAADRLLSIVGDLAPGLDLDDGHGVASALMQPKYTMARERDIHAQMLGDAPSAGPDTADVNDFLFAEAG